MQRRFFRWLPLLFAALASCFNPGKPGSGARDIQFENDSTPKPTKTVVAFYNLENLFDTKNDPRTFDEAFTPYGEMQWTPERYQIKLKNLSRVISLLGEENGPDILGVCEVENKTVIQDLLAQPALQNRDYRFVHEDSPDERGIDVALIYDWNVWQYVKHSRLAVDLPGEPNASTRLVLHTVLESRGQQMHVLINHWPSRREGQFESEPNRLAVARQVYNLLNEIRDEDPEARILVMGDFNDDPTNKSIREVLRSLNTPAKVGARDLYNPLANVFDPEDSGSLMHQGRWNLFDQIMVSRSLLHGPGWQYVADSAEVFHEEFMKVGGRGRVSEAPRRSYFRGDFSISGFSDHFPVFARLEWSE